MPRLLASGRRTACACPWLRCTPQNPSTSTIDAGPQLFSVCRTYCSGPSLMLGGVGLTWGSATGAGFAEAAATGAALLVVAAAAALRLASTGAQLVWAGAALASTLAGQASWARASTAAGCAAAGAAGAVATPQPASPTITIALSAASVTRIPSRSMPAKDKPQLRASSLGPR